MDGWADSFAFQLFAFQLFPFQLFVSLRLLSALLYPEYKYNYSPNSHLDVLASEAYVFLSSFCYPYAYSHLDLTCSFGVG